MAVAGITSLYMLVDVIEGDFRLLTSLKPQSILTQSDQNVCKSLIEEHDKEMFF